MTYINLLPWREESRKIEKIKFGLLLLAIVSLAIFTVFIVHLVLESVIHHSQERNQYLQTLLDNEQVVLGGLSKEKQIQMTITTDLQFIASLRETSYQAIRLLNELTKVVPSDVFLTKIIRNQNSITLVGQAKSSLEITRLMKNIEKSPVFKQPTLSEISAQGINTPNEKKFVIKVIQEN